MFILITSLSLSKLKFDLTFEYFKAAFSHNQLSTIDLLIDDQFKQSYTVPDQKLWFSFLNIEFKLQAKSNTHYIATNQVTDADVIILNDNLKLIPQSFEAKSFDFDKLQFFSVIIDYELA